MQRIGTALCILLLASAPLTKLSRDGGKLAGLGTSARTTDISTATIPLAAGASAASGNVAHEHGKHRYVANQDPDGLLDEP